MRAQRTITPKDWEEVGHHDVLEGLREECVTVFVKDVMPEHPSSFGEFYVGHVEDVVHGDDTSHLKLHGNGVIVLVLLDCIEKIEVDA